MLTWGYVPGSLRFTLQELKSWVWAWEQGQLCTCALGSIRPVTGALAGCSVADSFHPLPRRCHITTATHEVRKWAAYCVNTEPLPSRLALETSAYKRPYKEDDIPSPVRMAYCIHMLCQILFAAIQHCFAIGWNISVTLQKSDCFLSSRKLLEHSNTLSPSHYIK